MLTITPRVPNDWQSDVVPMWKKGGRGGGGKTGWGPFRGIPLVDHSGQVFAEMLEQ